MPIEALWRCNIMISEIDSLKYGIAKVTTSDGRSGTAFRISKTLLATAAHVVDGYSNVNISIGDKEYESLVLIREPAYDLAILEITKLPDIYAPLPIGKSSAIIIGEDLLIAGYPLGSSLLTVHHGFLSAKGTAKDFPAGKIEELDVNCPLLQIDGTVNEGFSGGPVFQISTKQVCGFITAKYGLLRNFSVLRKDLEELLRNPLIRQFKSSGGGVIIEGINFGKFTTFLLESLEIVSRSLTYLNVGIGYSVSIEALKPFIDNL